MNMLKKWAENYHKVLDDPESEEADAAREAYKATEEQMHVLSKSARKVLRLRYLEGASWAGIGKLLGMRAKWAEDVARSAERTLAALETPKKPN